MPKVKNAAPRSLEFWVDATATIAGTTTVIEPIEFYDDRQGYDRDFLGEDFRVALPRLSSKHDVATLKGGRKVLHYHNFSIAQSKGRRLPIYSACNVDGKKLKKVAKKSGMWRYDPRISPDFQILKECYGSAAESFFSRGHMTRRNDPVWGSNYIQAEKDTFVVTNAAPQMQGHNSPVWLGLEDHILNNAGKDKQRASVFTGPVLRARDPVIHGVRVPVEFWKIVAFIHDDTGDLASVAYLSSQADYLPVVEPTFVWGQFKGMQVTIERIEKITGLNFGRLRRADVLKGADATFARSAMKLNEILVR